MRNYLIILVLLFLFACSNKEQNTSSNVVDSNKLRNINNRISTQVKDTTNKQNQKTISQNNSLLYVLRGLDSAYRPRIVNLFFNNHKNILVYKSDNYLEFKYEKKIGLEQLFVEKFFDKNRKEYILFSGFIRDSSQIDNYFLFFTKEASVWKNITPLLVSNDVLSIISEYLKSDVSYARINKRLYAYYCKHSEKPIMFDFTDSPRLLVYSDSMWTTLFFLKFTDESLVISNSVYSSQKSAMLNSEELDNSPVYRNFLAALRDSDEVYVLDLSGNEFSSISPQIRKLKRLQILILNDNNLQSLPNAIFALKNLQIIRVDNNNLQSLPEEIGLLPHLDEISASYNELTRLPISLSQAKNIKYLNLDNNRLSSFLPDCSHLKELRTLNLSHNNLKTLPQDIGMMKNLMSIDISNNPISSLPESIYKLKHLVYIDLTKTNIPDSQVVRLMGINPDLNVVMN
jgi:Leucine-rich repeat (LRR) protein